LPVGSFSAVPLSKYDGNIKTPPRPAPTPPSLKQFQATTYSTK
jgi:hypothetical protein